MFQYCFTFKKIFLKEHLFEDVRFSSHDESVTTNLLSLANENYVSDIGVLGEGGGNAI